MFGFSMQVTTDRRMDGSKSKKEEVKRSAEGAMTRMKLPSTWRLQFKMNMKETEFDENM